MLGTEIIILHLLFGGRYLNWGVLFDKTNWCKVLKRCTLVYMILWLIDTTWYLNIWKLLLVISSCLLNALLSITSLKTAINRINPYVLQNNCCFRANQCDVTARIVLFQSRFHFQVQIKQMLSPTLRSVFYIEVNALKYTLNYRLKVSAALDKFLIEFGCV